MHHCQFKIICLLWGDIHWDFLHYLVTADYMHVQYGWCAKQKNISFMLAWVEWKCKLIQYLKSYVSCLTYFLLKYCDLIEATVIMTGFEKEHQHYQMGICKPTSSRQQIRSWTDTRRKVVSIPQPQLYWLNYKISLFYKPKQENRDKTEILHEIKT